MQRIDENTYIDDTLVTCAEYQLFIDEMREQGKYYQPDHWTSYQFPNGHALNPIAGIRLNDVIAFCEWLTKREKEEWLFRLPNSLEAIAHPLKTVKLLNLGFWSVDIDGKPDFVWLGGLLVNARGLDQVNAHDYILHRKINLVVDLNADFSEANYLEHNLNIDWTKAEKVDYDRTQSFNRTFGLTSNCPLDIIIGLKNVEREINFALSREVTKKGWFDVVPRSETYRILTIARKLPRYIENELVRKSGYTRNFNQAQTLAIMIDRIVTFASYSDNEIHHEACLDLLIDLFTLQERIAGRSPAFEGIRLVKERIR